MRRLGSARKFVGGPPTLETERLTLRRLSPEDAKAVFAYASDPEMVRYVAWDRHYTIEDSKAFLDLTLAKYEGGGEPDWGIVYKGDGRFVGTCGFVGWAPEHARAEIGCALARGYWDRGLVTEVVRALIRFGFERMDLNRVEARCVAENLPAARVMEKAGMTYEGTSRQREFFKSAYHDMKTYAILRGDPR